MLTSASVSLAGARECDTVEKRRLDVEVVSSCEARGVQFHGHVRTMAAPWLHRDSRGHLTSLLLRMIRRACSLRICTRKSREERVNLFARLRGHMFARDCTRAHISREISSCRCLSCRRGRGLLIARDLTGASALIAIGSDDVIGYQLVGRVEFARSHDHCAPLSTSYLT